MADKPLPSMARRAGAAHVFLPKRVDPPLSKTFPPRWRPTPKLRLRTIPKWRLGRGGSSALFRPSKYGGPLAISRLPFRQVLKPAPPPGLVKPVSLGLFWRPAFPGACAKLVVQGPRPWEHGGAQRSFPGMGEAEEGSRGWTWRLPGAPVAAGVLCGALAVLVLLGVRDVLFLYEENRCSMTYMFEYPEYLKIKLPRKISRRYPAYELYLYGEGSYAEENRNLLLTGIPVLFLPGNAGSFKQVRSLGSIALRKAEDLDFKYHFDVFSVNFNEELVALYGGSLQRQTRFVHECIKVILKLYKGREFAPRSVALVGHSMGGLVARALLTLKNFKAELLTVVVTQATPHMAPVMPLDQYLTDFYTAVNHNWILKAQEIRNLTTLSVAGGFRDYQVRSGLAFLPRSNQPNCALSVVSSGVPRVWASTDHLSIVWCKELILATVRAFFDLIDENTKQITEDPHKRMLVLNHHFLRHPAKFLGEQPEPLSELTGALTWVQIKASKWSYTVYNESDGKYFTFPLSSHRKSYSHVHCQNNILDTHSWMFGCINSTSSMCLQGVDLTWKAELLPTVKVVTLKLQDYPSLTHLVLHVPAVNGNKFTLDCEFFNEASRTVQLPVTHLLSFGFSSSKIILNSTGLIHNIQLQHFGQIYQAFKIYVESHCQSFKERRSSVYRLHIPWSHEDSLTWSQVPSSTEISAKLHIAQPENDTTVPVLNIYSSSDCIYEVTLKTSFLQVLGQVIRFHGGIIPVYIISNILLAYGRQLKSLISTGQCSDFVPALTKAARPYKVEPVVNIIKFLLGLSSSLWLAVTRPSDLPPDNRLLTPRRLCVAASIVLLSWTTCGALAILITYSHYVFKVIKLHSNVRTELSVLNMSSKNSEQISDDSKKECGKSCESVDSIAEAATSSIGPSAIDRMVDSLRMHVTVINLLTWIVLLTCPSLIYWLKNLRYHITLDPDPYRFLALILIAILEILMNSNTTKVKSSKLLKIAVHLPFPSSVAVVAFTPMHLYRIPYFVIIPLFLHASCSIV
ncbi:GPI inositol-deacylase isoform X2 [Hemicordylus capensis]|uniref:GPI inositol-deacylase isoform X2 n=1 Tax=Hemicordylus capensis TaxID=884348 RepID=UPI0023031289|nr:GPI inositol-deacylase isoform X2 [Hemicordylus capensis]